MLIQLHGREVSTDIIRDISIAQLLVPDDAKRLIEASRKVVPFEHILVTGLDFEGYRTGTGTILATDFPAAYLASYFAEDLFTHDPMARMCITQRRRVTDEEAWATEQSDDADGRLRQLHDRYAIRNRIAVPLTRADRIYGSLVVTSEHRLTVGQEEYLSFIAEPLHSALSKRFIPEITKRLGLTKGELQCVELASRGLTSEEIAEETAYSVLTVNSYLKAVTKKLSCANRTEAVAEAIRRGLIG
ncbi:putative transcriptional regulator protein, LuxR family [Rhizobium freirei PRF 81]|uniref:Putative transcriptional regulator protein, LuxR family n=1 Tax=Rhizobium freirei PRF 81 TaxID=363754 RepID=N6U1P2_9HYPH|nr:LuxR family transcriptional regulator [Rhizobium freirei]ENN86549.1 putative transcriptional regulator protein, LuxR family [Rhizobium freirei PRF 81]